MSTENPYQAPAANVVEPDQDIHGDFQFVEPQRVPIGNGWTWLADGFSLFVKSPLIWIVNFILFGILMVVSAFIPFATNVLNPIFVGGFMNGSRALDNGEPLEVGHLFSGFNQDGGKLAIVGLLYLAGTFVLMMVMVIVMLIAMFGLGVFDAMAADQDPTLMISIAIIFYLLVFALMLPLMMAYWFAPALVVFHGKEPFEALKLSFMGCLKNILPFLLYSIIGLLFLVIATLPFMLGWLVIMPVFIASMYTSYKDIFTAKSAA